MKMRRYIFGFVKVMAVVAAVLLTMPSCSLVYEPVVEEGGLDLLKDANLRLYINVPSLTKSTDYEDYNSPMNQEGMDNQIVAEDLAVYFFDLDGKLVSVCNSNHNIVVSKVSSEGFNPHYHLYCADLKVEGITNNVQYRIVVVANSRSIYTANMPFAVPNFSVGKDLTEEQLYEKLKFGYSNDKFKFGNHVAYYTMENFNMFERAAVPMWGFKAMTVEVRGAENHDKLNVSGTINMIRSVAKVRINISDDLMKYVVVSDENPNSSKGGARLFCPVGNGYMTPAYSKVASLTETPSMMHKDRVGGKADGAYTNVWLNTGDFKSDVETQICYPFYRYNDRTFYTYLPECELGDAYMKIEFKWTDTHLSEDIYQDYKLEFADYANTDMAPSEDDLTRFPIMRNHYYIYNIIGLNPLRIKYEVCEWEERETEILFN